MKGTLLTFTIHYYSAQAGPNIDVVFKLFVCFLLFLNVMSVQYSTFRSVPHRDRCFFVLTARLHIYIYIINTCLPYKEQRFSCDYQSQKQFEFFAGMFLEKHPT